MFDFDEIGKLFCSYIPSSGHEACMLIAQELHKPGPIQIIAKILFMLLVLYIMLKVLARSNRIKKTLRWPQDIPNWTENRPGEKGIRVMPESAVPGTLHARFIRLPPAAMNDGAKEMYENRIADVTFNYEGAEGKQFKYSHALKVSVWTGATETENGYGYIAVDQNTWNGLDNVVRSAAGEGRKPQLRAALFSVELKARKFRAVSFLLFHHPDPAFRITGWVTVLTAIYSLLQSIVFGS
jgi:hypothetical protein